MPTDHGIRGQPTDIVCEDPPCKSSGLQCQMLASLRTAAWAVAELYPDIRVFCVPVTTLKKFATGTGHARKPEMAVALAQRIPHDYKLVEGGLIQKADGSLADHNEVDAIWLALYAEAVERGERSFLGAYQRKQIKLAERKRKRDERKTKARLKRAAQAAEDKARQRAVSFALKSLGPCCGVFRKRDRHLAVCPKCGRRVALPVIIPLPEVQRCFTQEDPTA